MDDAVQVVTTALAVLGAVLGVMNVWRNWLHDKVNVQVLYAGAITTLGRPGMNITVRNLSRFAVTVDGVSLCFSGDVHMPVNLLDGSSVLPNPLPVRLEARTALTVFIPVTAVADEQMNRFSHIKATTACGFEFTSFKRTYL